MKNNWTHERISRKANSIQWTGANTDAVLARLTQHGMIGELFRDIHIQVYKGGSYDDTINIGMWLVVGEDSVLRFYPDEKFRLMYQSINDELERLRAFAREILDRDRGDDVGGDELQELGEKYGMLELHFPSAPCGELCSCADVYHFVEFDHGTVKCYRLAESLKAHE